jgi:arylsulfatase
VQQRPNVLWVCSDQQRYDTIAAHGCGAIRTPHLDRLAREGVSFMNAYTQSPVCTPSRASFMTGRYPASHHVHRNGNDHFPVTETIVSRRFKDGGFSTGLIGKHHLSRSENRIELMPEDGYDFAALGDCWPIGRDYDTWLQAHRGIANPQALYPGLLSRSPRDYGPGLPLDLQQATWWAEVAVDFVLRKHDAPWFLNLNAVDPHPPFFPPPEFLDRYRREEMPLPLYRESDVARQEAFWKLDQQWKKIYDVRHYDASEDIDQSGTPLSERNLFDFPPDVYDARMIRACYYAMIEMVDDRLGQVLDALDRSGQADNTIVIFTSDHGEMLGDHGMLYKGCRFFEGLVHVPMIVRWPRRIAPGRRSHALVELIDIAPTLLDAARLDIPANMHGVSLLPLLTGQAQLHRHKRCVISEFNGALAGMPYQSHGTMVFDGRFKSCVYQGLDIGEIYDLRQDPGEFDNLWDQAGFEGEKARLLHRHLDTLMAASDAGIERTGMY